MTIKLPTMLVWLYVKISLKIHKCQLFVTNIKLFWNVIKKHLLYAKKWDCYKTLFTLFIIFCRQFLPTPITKHGYDSNHMELKII